jgi:hypothetical protein
MPTTGSFSPEEGMVFVIKGSDDALVAADASGEPSARPTPPARPLTTTVRRDTLPGCFEFIAVLLDYLQAGDVA